MKRISLLLLLIIFSLYHSSLFAQYQRATMWLEKMEQFATDDLGKNSNQVDVLFVGSSSINLWKTLESDFPQVNLLNRAFGGSFVSDVIYFFDQVIKPYNPKQIVVYEGDNDLHDSDKTPLKYFEELLTLCNLIEVHFPAAQIVVISIKPSPSRAKVFDKYMVANELVKNYAMLNDNIQFVDIWDDMFLEDGSPNESLYLSDRLHMNSDGYLIWKNKLDPILIRNNR